MNRTSRQRQPLVCPACGQVGNRPPGLRLDEYNHLAAVFVGDEAVPPPQRVTCRNCGRTWPVARCSIEVRKP